MATATKRKPKPKPARQRSLFDGKPEPILTPLSRWTRPKLDKQAEPNWAAVWLDPSVLGITVDETRLTTQPRPAAQS